MFSRYKGNAMKTVSDTILRRAFYHLLAFQVNGKVIDSNLFSSLSDKDWRGVIAFAHKQGLAGLCMEKIIFNNETNI